MTVDPLSENDITEMLFTLESHVRLFEFLYMYMREQDMLSSWNRPKLQDLKRSAETTIEDLRFAQHSDYATIATKAETVFKEILVTINLFNKEIGQRIKELIIAI